MVRQNNQNFNEVLEEVKKKYNLPNSPPEEGLTQETVNKINKEVFE